MEGEIYRWTDLVRYLEANYEAVALFQGDRFRLTYKLGAGEVPVGGQIIRSPAGNPWLVFAIKLCVASKLRTRSALVANVDLPFGGLALLGDHAVLRQSIPLHGVRESDIAMTLRSLATQAQQLRDVSELQDADVDAPYAYVFH